MAPPFERLYLDHREAVFRFLSRRVGHPAAEDAFQETFLRALRAYPKLRHGTNLRGWLIAIAARVAVDHARRRTTTGELREPAVVDARPAYAELEHLADDLPPTERTAVVLRYGYDLAYADIAEALGSSEDAARQAASSGIRRIRRRMNT